MQGLRSCLSTVGGVAVVALLLVAVAAPAAYVELAGRTASGVVAARSEQISVRYGEWSRALRLEVRYTPADTDTPELARIPVSPERYDRAAVGDAVQVRYMPRPDIRALGEIAAPRLVDQPPLGQLAARVGGGAPFFALLALFLLLLWAWSATRRGWLLAPLALMLLGGSLFLVSDPPLPAPPGPQRDALATVQLVRQVDRLGRSTSSRRAFKEALQPYNIVALEFVPAGAAGPVVAVDLVDVGSVPGLELGAQVPIRYSAADPRWARVVGATRTYAWKNLYGYAVIGGLLLLLVAGAWLAGRRARARKRHP